MHTHTYMHGHVRSDLCSLTHAHSPLACCTHTCTDIYALRLALADTHTPLGLPVRSPNSDALA